MTNLPAAILEQAINRAITRLRDRGVNVANLRSQIAERLENKVLETFLALMNPEQLDRYEQALNTEDTEKIQMVSAEIAAAIPELTPALEQVLETEYENIIREFTPRQ